MDMSAGEVFMTPMQRDFIEAELFQLTLAAVTQRGKVYKEKITESSRAPVHATLREKLDELTSAYITQVTDDPHIANIQVLSDVVSEKHGGVLVDGRFRIGSAQKALNLHLKYRWCLGEIHEPPHCPFDACVLKLIPGWKSESWIEINTLERYQDLVAAARSVAAGKSLAVWELGAYNEATR
jgi:hypothetical protein